MTQLILWSLTLMSCQLLIWIYQLVKHHHLLCCLILNLPCMQHWVLFSLCPSLPSRCYGQGCDSCCSHNGRYGSTSGSSRADCEGNGSGCCRQENENDML